MRNEDELRDLLSTTATEVADFSGNPRTWLSWILYLMGELEKRSLDANPEYQERYQDLLFALRDAILQRIKLGAW
jgi:hypothetical protein